MSALAYPAELPCPVSLPQQQAERRALTDGNGPRMSRALWRDRLVPAAPVVFRFRTQAQVDVFIAWLESDQIQGGAWFAIDWRLTNGCVGVARFVALPSFPQYLAPNVWECSGTVEIRGRSLPPQSHVVNPDAECVDGPGSIGLYTLESGDAGVFTNGSSVYGQTLDIASQNSPTIANISRPYAVDLATTFQLKFMVETANADDGCAIEWVGPGGTVLIFNPIREAALDTNRRPYIQIASGVVYLLPAQVVTGEWYSLLVKLIAGSNAAFATITRLSTGASATVHGTASPADVSTLHVYDDRDGVTSPTRYAAFHVCPAGAA